VRCDGVECCSSRSRVQGLRPVVAAEGLPVGPFGLQRAIKAFYLAVPPGTVGFDEDLTACRVAQTSRSE
jgi:hypothetical protein